MPSGSASKARRRASHQWVGTGQRVYVSSARATAAEARADVLIARARDRREHVWIAAVAFLVTPPFDEDTGAMLDSENMLGYPGIGCFICEAVWIDGAEHSVCPGDPPGPPYSAYSP